MGPWVSIAMMLAASAAHAQPSAGDRADCEGEVIYSTLSWAWYSSYDKATGNGFGGVGFFDGLYDLQIADDFTTTDSNVLTCVTGAYLGFSGRSPAGGLQVDVWTHTGAGPGSLVASQTSLISAFKTYDDGLFGLEGRYMTAAVNIPLAPHTEYYIAIQPVDLTCAGDWYYMITKKNSRLGTTAYLRDGARGEDPGYGFTTWTATTEWGYHDVRDYSMELRAVPGPAPCRADCNGDGVLDQRDVVCFLSAWAAGCDHEGHVIYSTLGFVDDQEYDTADRCTWSGKALLHEVHDQQIADDFETTADSTITRVTGDYVTWFGGDPRQGMQVDVWTFTPNGPGELVTSTTVPAVASSIWEDSVLGKVGVRLSADVRIPLEPYTRYYLVAQPIDLTRDGDMYLQIRSTTSSIGSDAYGRDGGRCVGGYGPAWRSMGALGLGAGDAGVEIRAVADQAPCVADCDGDGRVDIRDLVCFLNHWASGCAG